MYYLQRLISKFLNTPIIVTDNDISRYSLQVDSVTEKVTELEVIVRELEEWTGELGTSEFFLTPLLFPLLLPRTIEVSREYANGDIQRSKFAG